MFALSSYEQTYGGQQIKKVEPLRSDCRMQQRKGSPSSRHLRRYNVNLPNPAVAQEDGRLPTLSGLSMFCGRRKRLINPLPVLSVYTKQQLLHISSGLIHVFPVLVFDIGSQVQQYNPPASAVRSVFFFFW